MNTSSSLFIGTDHRGFELKNQLVEWLKAEGLEVTDCGAFTLDPNDDYPDFALAVAEKVARYPDTRGIVLCDSGVGVTVIANKVSGIQACLLTTPAEATKARQDDNLNVLALAAGTQTLDTAKAVITAFLETPYVPEERFERRLGKIRAYEKNAQPHTSNTSSRTVAIDHVLDQQLDQDVSNK